MIKGSGELACTTYRGTPGKIEGTAEVLWENGDQSTIEFRAGSNGLLPPMKYKVTDGELKGSTAHQELIPTGITGHCGDTLVTSHSDSRSMTVVSDQ